jgi:PAT family beta-lactamase induction signal transducer AmpG
MYYLSQNRSLRLAALCILYVSQGLPDGFVRTGLKTYLIREGASTAQVGSLIAMVSWPWAVKWIWGPMVDRFGGSSLGRRRPWILAAQLGMGLTLAAILLIPDLPNSVRLLGLAVLLINCFSSMQDVAIDALAIDLLPEQERGVANGLMFGSADIGRFLGGAVIGGILLNYGIRPAVLLEIVFLLAIATCPLLIRERPGDALFPGRRRSFRRAAEPDAPSPSVLQLLGQLKKAFSRRASLLAALLAGFSLTATSAHLVFWPVHVQRSLKWTSNEYLQLEGMYGVGFGLAGSLIGGVVASTLGARRSVMLALGSQALCWFIYALTADAWDDRSLVAVLFCVGAWLFNFFQVSMFALFMGVCRGPVAATQFSTYMALLNVSGSLGSVFAGYVDSDTSLPRTYIFLGCSQLALMAVTAFIRSEPAATAERPK